MIRKGDPIKFKPEFSDDGAGDVGQYVAMEDSYAHDTENPRVRIIAINTNLAYPPSDIVSLSMLEGH